MLRSKQGALLLEVLLVIVVLSVGLTLLIRSLSSCMHALVISVDYSRAAFLAENKMSEVIIRKTIDPDFDDSGSFKVPFDKFKYEIRTVNSPWVSSNPEAPQISKIEMDISWASGQNDRNMSMSTCLFNSP